MKKNILKNSLILIISFSALLFSSCQYILFNQDSSTLSRRPNIDKLSEGGFFVYVEKTTDLEYVNFYRTDVASGEEMNIGLVCSKNWPDKNTSHGIEDKYVIKGRVYKYRCRIYDGSKYTWSNYTNEYTAPDTSVITEADGLPGYTINTGAMVTYNTDSRKICLYDGDSHDLIVPSTVADFDKDFEPALVIEIKSDGTRHYFRLDSTHSETYYQELLTSEFFDTEIEIVGIAGIKRTFAYNDKGELTDKEKTVNFSRISQLPVYTVDADGTVSEVYDRVIKIESPTATKGWDGSFQS